MYHLKKKSRFFFIYNIKMFFVSSDLLKALDIETSVVVIKVISKSGILI